MPLRFVFVSLFLAWLVIGCQPAAQSFLESSLQAEPAPLKISVQPTKQLQRHVPIRVPLADTIAVQPGTTATVTSSDREHTFPAQITKRRLLSQGDHQHELVFLLPETPQDQPAHFEITWGTAQKQNGFSWKETEPGKALQLKYQDRPVLAYMHESLDDSTPKRREATYKVFHHVYDPTGTQMVTKGPGGRYTHHRGLFFGFSKVSYQNGKKKVDIWHCRGNAHQAHQEVLSTETGPVLGRHLVKIHWYGPGKEEHFATELREVTAYHTEDGLLIEFASQLSSHVGDLKLDGDPQHAGFHFRASNEVAAKTNKQTYYLRTDGPGKPRETRNWPQKKDHVDLPWNAMSFVVGDQRLTAVYLDSPQNPKPARYSERDYGRFGSYFVTTVREDQPLQVNYRLWLQKGEMTVEQAAALDAAFDHPPSTGIQLGKKLSR